MDNKERTTIIVNPAEGFEHGDEGLFLVDDEIVDVRIVFEEIYKMEETKKMLRGRRLDYDRD